MTDVSKTLSVGAAISVMTVDRSFQARSKRRASFLWQVVCAWVEWKRLVRLVPHLESACKRHSWIVRIGIQLRTVAGKEPGSTHWDAPVALTIYAERHHRKRKQSDVGPALCMSVFLLGKVLTVRQLQGMADIHIPEELREWPQLFVEACRAFARQENLKAVRLPKANTLYSYKNPSFWTGLPPEERQERIRRARQRMEYHYDHTARLQGFVLQDAWYVWKNPDYRPR